jgi:hypothetical protein
MNTGAARHEEEFASDAHGLTSAEADFAAQIATAVWLRRLTDDAAREALGSYAMACGRGKGGHARLAAALEWEYRRCRERQDLCS